LSRSDASIVEGVREVVRHELQAFRQEFRLEIKGIKADIGRLESNICRLESNLTKVYEDTSAKNYARLIIEGRFQMTILSGPTTRLFELSNYDEETAKKYAEVCTLLYVMIFNT
jgi:hypothetical protein